MQNEWWLTLLLSLASGGVVHWRHVRKQSSDDKSMEFNQMKGVTEEYQRLYKIANDRYNIMESKVTEMNKQQVENTASIARLATREEECQKTVGVLSNQVAHLSEQNKQLLNFLTNNEKK